MASFLDVCRFNAVSSGTGSFVVSSAATGYQTPASANAVNGATYRYRAESADLSQWEVGYGTYTVSTTTLTRSTILFNSSGGTTAISFTAAPQVAIVALAEDLAQLPFFESTAINPTGTTSTVAVMMGMGSTCTITPLRTGRLWVWWKGGVFNSSTLTGKIQAYVGTSTAPANGVGVSGTAVGPTVNAVSAAANQLIPFSAGGIITGLSPGTAYWIDLSLTSTAGSTETLSAVQLSVMEF